MPWGRYSAGVSFTPSTSVQYLASTQGRTTRGARVRPSAVMDAARVMCSASPPTSTPWVTDSPTSGSEFTFLPDVVSFPNEKPVSSQLLYRSGVMLCSLMRWAMVEKCDAKLSSVIARARTDSSMLSF